MAVHNEQRLRGTAPDDAQVTGSYWPYRGDRARHALRLLLEAAVAQRLGMPDDTRALSPQPPRPRLRQWPPT